jgi:pre-mRNA-splicing factor ATP-dependent RNA helicase DHX15/PRP43
MAVRKADFDDPAPAKRQKTSTGNMDPRNNPYLQHMYADESTDSISTNPNPSSNTSNGYNTPPRRVNSFVGSGHFAKFQRHKTTAALAQSAEDGQTNPFTGQPFSDRYVSILRTRRDLPVHSQR